MSIQEESTKGAEADTEAQAGAEAEVTEDSAEFDSAWDDLEDKSGQPSEAEGRQDEADEDDEDEADEAGQGEAKADATPSADAGTASREETSDDPGDDPVKLKAALAAEREAKVKAESVASSHGGRLAQALNELNDLKKQLKPEKAKGATPEGEEAEDEDERIKQLKEDYPEVAVPLLEKMAQLEDDLRKLQGGKEATSEEATEAEVQTLLREQLDTLKSRHGDFEKAVTSEDYKTWLPQAPAWAQRVIRENTPNIVNAAECAEVLDLFKSKTGWGGTKREADETVEQKRKRQLDAGSGVTGRQPAVTHDEEGNWDSEWDRLAERDRRRSTGRR